MPNRPPCLERGVWFLPPSPSCGGRAAILILSCSSQPSPCPSLGTEATLSQVARRDIRSSLAQGHLSSCWTWCPGSGLHTHFQGLDVLSNIPAPSQPGSGLGYQRSLVPSAPVVSAAAWTQDALLLSKWSHSQKQSGCQREDKGQLLLVFLKISTSPGSLSIQNMPWPKAYSAEI